MVEVLLTMSNRDANATTDHGGTPLHYVILNGYCTEALVMGERKIVALNQVTLHRAESSANKGLLIAQHVPTVTAQCGYI